MWISFFADITDRDIVEIEYSLENIEINFNLLILSLDYSINQIILNCNYQPQLKSCNQFEENWYGKMVFAKLIFFPPNFFVLRKNMGFDYCSQNLFPHDKF